MSKQNLLLFIGSLLFLTSCGGWTEKDKAEFLRTCEKNKLNSEFCECALEKATTKYSDFETAMKDETGIGEAFINCIEKDRIEEEKVAE